MTAKQTANLIVTGYCENRTTPEANQTDMINWARVNVKPTVRQGAYIAALPMAMKALKREIRRAANSN